MYIEAATIIILLVIAINFYSRFKKLENEVNQLKNQIYHLENNIFNRDEPNDKEYIKIETENWIELKKHLDRLIEKNIISKGEANSAWDSALKDQVYILSLVRFIKNKEKDLPTEDRFAGLLFEETPYDDYSFTKIITNLEKKLKN